MEKKRSEAPSNNGVAAPLVISIISSHRPPGSLSRRSISAPSRSFYPQRRRRASANPDRFRTPSHRTRPPSTTAPAIRPRYLFYIPAHGPRTIGSRAFLCDLRYFIAVPAPIRGALSTPLPRFRSVVASRDLPIWLGRDVLHQRRPLSQLDVASMRGEESAARAIPWTAATTSASHPSKLFVREVGVSGP